MFFITDSYWKVVGYLKGAAIETDKGFRHFVKNSRFELLDLPSVELRDDRTSWKTHWPLGSVFAETLGYATSPVAQPVSARLDCTKWLRIRTSG